jgi:hypothetical protein
MAGFEAFLTKILLLFTYCKFFEKQAKGAAKISRIENCG